MEQGTLSELTQRVSQFADQSFGKGDSGAFAAFSVFLGALKEELQEAVLTATRPAIQDILLKLKNKAGLSETELELVRLWIVGNTEYYSQSDNRLKNWIQEIKHLVSEIQKFKDLPSDAKNCLLVQSLVFDLDRNLQNVIKLLEDMERVKRFSESTQKMHDEEVAILVKMLERKLQSSIL